MFNFQDRGVFKLIDLEVTTLNRRSKCKKNWESDAVVLFSAEIFLNSLHVPSVERRAKWQRHDYLLHEPM